MNSELVKKALEKVADPYVLVNLISRRVRELNAGARALSRSAPGDSPNSGVADIALREIVEGKMGFEMPEFVELTRPTATNRRRPHGWTKPRTTKYIGSRPAPAIVPQAGSHTSIVTAGDTAGVGDEAEAPAIGSFAGAVASAKEMGISAAGIVEPIRTKATTPRSGFEAVLGEPEMVLSKK
jgi:DNA-directed RNA polymerase subunit omega